MKIYYNSLIILMLVSNIACIIAPNPEASKKIIRPVCGLMLLLTLVSPLSGLIENFRSTGFDKILSGEEEKPDGYETLAYTVLGYLSEEYGIEDGEVVIITDENVKAESVTEIQLFIENCPYNIKEAIQIELREEYGVEVRVYSGG